MGSLYKRTRASMLHQVIVHIILIAVIFATFFVATAGKVTGQGVKQQVLEKQLALLIDSSIPGMSFEMEKVQVNGLISRVAVSDGRVFVDVDRLVSLTGYPYFSPYRVSVMEESDKFVVSVR